MLVIKPQRTSNMWSTDKSGNSAQNGNAPRNFGMTSAISTAGPKPEDLQATDELRKCLERFNVFESDKELNHRMEILAKLNTLANAFIKDLSIGQNVPSETASKLGGKIHTFGSYRLGVHSPGADIDALCIAPRNVTREEFFTLFTDVLKKQPEVTECRAIEEAYVPVVKMNFDGIEIDLLFARLALKEIPDDFDLSDDLLLKNLDMKCVRSLNGCRVTDEILKLVPIIESYRLALRAIKLWAKRKFYFPTAGDTFLTLIEFFFPGFYMKLFLSLQDAKFIQIHWDTLVVFLGRCSWLAPVNYIQMRQQRQLCINFSWYFHVGRGQIPFY